MAVAIVAIPRKDDITWKLSSEKVPHLTLLFLGDQLDDSKVSKIVEFVEHVSTMALTPFELSVDYRGKLGEKDADVLFFKQDRWGFQKIRTVRDFLLQHNLISAAYASVEQFETWTPHLTMGYPNKPAKPDKRDHPYLDWVEFDRLAVWTDDFEGPEFQLKYDDSDDLAVQMSEALDSVLVHYGVKGMKWGVRKKSSTRSGAHPDAVKAKLFKEKVKKGSTDALSTDELRDLVTRLNLEKQFDTLKPPTPGSRTKKLLAETLLQVGRQQATKAVNDQASKQITKLLTKASK